MYIDMVGRDNFYLELIWDLLPHVHRLNEALVQLAAKLRVKVVATNNVHYADKRDFPLHDTLTCIRTLTQVEDVHPERSLNAENYLKSPAEMARLFAEYPKAIASTQEIAQRCQPALDLTRHLFPAFPVPTGQSAAAYLRELTHQGAIRRYHTITPPIRERLEHELSIITRLQVEDYFLVMWDIACFARQNGIRYAGRGSAADSAVVYCLGSPRLIPSPEAFYLNVFEPGTGPKPDIDIDFDARYRIMSPNMSMTIWHGACSLSLPLIPLEPVLPKGFCKALGFPAAEVNSLAKRFPRAGRCHSKLLWANSQKVARALCQSEIPTTL